jgi:hypothetical protein
LVDLTHRFLRLMILAANPADEVANLINSNWTAAAELADNGSLACLALQYVHDSSLP